MAQARASAASAAGSPGSASSRLTIACTCCLAAWPWPDHRLLHLQRGVFRHRQAGEHAAQIAVPRAWPRRERRLRVGVDEHLPTATSAGPCSSMTPQALQDDFSRSASSPAPDLTQPLVT